MSNKVIVNGVDVFEELEKQKKLLKLYKELMTIKDDMINKLIFDVVRFLRDEAETLELVDKEYYDMEKKEQYLEKQIRELENENNSKCYI